MPSRFPFFHPQAPEYRCASLHRSILVASALLCWTLLSSVPVLAQSQVTVRSGMVTVTNGALRLGGDFASDATFDATEGTVGFLGSTDQQFVPGPGATIKRLTVTKRAATTAVLLADSISVTDSVLVLTGDLDLNGKQIDLADTGGLRERAGQTVRGTSGTITATRFLNAPNAVDVAGLGARITSDKNMSATVVTRGHAPQSGTSTNEGIARYYDITPAINTELDATLELFYDESELNGKDESTLSLWNSTDAGDTYREVGGTVIASANVIARSGIDAFSRWTATSSDAPLPVELATFEARRDAEQVRLTWDTASETNNAGFHVERRVEDASTPGVRLSANDTWTDLGFVEGRGTTDEAQRYRFTDRRLPFASDSLSYRLRQVDLDGTATLTDPVVVRLGGPDRLQLFAPYPNPARGAATLRYALPTAADARIEVYNVLGQRVATLASGPQAAGRVEQTLDTSRLPSGLYFVRMRAGGQIQTQRLTVVR